MATRNTLVARTRTLLHRAGTWTMAALGPLYLLGVGASTVLAQAAPSQVILLSGTVPQQVGAPVVAAAKGFFKSEGLEVQHIPFTTGAAAGEAFVSGQGDFIIAGDYPAIKLWASGVAVGIVPHTDAPDALIIVSKVGIKGPGDLRGKTLATRLGSTLEPFVYKYLERGGLTKNDVKMIDLAPPEMVIALDKGDIDAYAWAQPYGWRSLEVSGPKVHILTTAKGMLTERVVVNVRRAFLERRPEDVTRFVRAIVKASDYIREHPQDASQLVANFLKLDVPTTARIMGILNFRPIYSRAFRADLDAMADYMIQQKALAKPIDWSSAFRPDFLKATRTDLVEP